MLCLFEHSFQNFLVSPARSCASDSNPEPTHPRTRVSGLSEEQQNGVLNILNASTREMLDSYTCFNSAFGLLQVDSIMENKEQNGPLKDLSHLNHLKFINSKSAKEICRSISRGRKIKKSFRGSQRFTLDKSVIHPSFSSQDVSITLVITY